MAINWYGLKTEYITKACSITELAKKYRCHTSTINKRARKDGWIKFKYEDILKEHEALEESGTVLDSAEVSAGHRVLWNGVKKRLIKGLRSTNVKDGLDELKVAKAAGEVLSNVVKGEKIAWGLNDDVLIVSEEDTEIECIISKMDSLTVPQDSGSSLEGE